MGRALRRLLVRTVRYLILRPVALFGVVVVLLVLVGAAIVLPAVADVPLAVPALRLAAPLPSGEPKATEEYLRGNRDYDATLIWDSLSREAQQRLQSQGGSIEELARQVQTAKQRGLKLEEITYVGGKALPDGTSMQFYVVALRPQAQASVQYVPYIFTLDRNGKIAKVQ